MKKKIYYIPGMISLILLPLLIIFWINRQEKAKLYALEVRVFKKGQKDWDVEVKPPVLNYTTIQLTGDRDANQIKLAYADIQLEEAKVTNDTTKGIHFHFDESCHYNDFVQVASLMRKSNVDPFICYTKDAWAVALPETKHTTSKYLSCGTSSMALIKFPEGESEYVFLSDCKKVTILSLGILVLAILSVAKMRRITSVSP